jgi:hypothetical protein
MASRTKQVHWRLDPDLVRWVESVAALRGISAAAAANGLLAERHAEVKGKRR